MRRSKFSRRLIAQSNFDFYSLSAYATMKYLRFDPLIRGREVALSPRLLVGLDPGAHPLSMSAACAQPGALRQQPAVQARQMPVPVGQSFPVFRLTANVFSAARTLPRRSKFAPYFAYPLHAAERLQHTVKIESGTGRKAGQRAPHGLGGPHHFLREFRGRSRSQFRQRRHWCLPPPLARLRALRAFVAANRREFHANAAPALP